MLHNKYVRDVAKVYAEQATSRSAHPPRPPAQGVIAVDSHSAVDLGFAGGGNLGLRWGQDRQVFYCDDVVFSHEGLTDTEPSHDLAHLLVAANGNLLWQPAGTDADVRIAEYNAIFIEHLLDKIFNSIMYSSIELTSVLDETLRHARWFVEEHFAPFPMPAEEAYKRLRREINPATVSRLSPLFFKLRWQERTDPNYRQTGVGIQFGREDTPVANGKAREFSTAVGSLLGYISVSSFSC